MEQEKWQAWDRAPDLTPFPSTQPRGDTRGDGGDLSRGGCLLAGAAKTSASSSRLYRPVLLREGVGSQRAWPLGSLSSGVPAPPGGEPGGGLG